MRDLRALSSMSPHAVEIDLDADRTSDLGNSGVTER